MVASNAAVRCGGCRCRFKKCFADTAPAKRTYCTRRLWLVFRKLLQLKTQPRFGLQWIVPSSLILFHGATSFFVFQSACPFENSGIARVARAKSTGIACLKRLIFPCTYRRYDQLKAEIRVCDALELSIQNNASSVTLKRLVQEGQALLKSAQTIASESGIGGG